MLDSKHALADRDPHWNRSSSCITAGDTDGVGFEPTVRF